MTSTSTRVTAEQFADMPEPGHGGKMELVRGEVVCMVPVNAEHGRVARRIGARLGDFADERVLGDVGVEVGYRITSNPDTVLAPDVSYLASISQGSAGFVEGAPTLAVEVVSPNDRDTDIQSKVEAYLAAGVERVWVVRPEQRSVTVYRGGGTARILHEAEALTSDDAGFSVEGFSLPVGGLFAR